MRKNNRLYTIILVGLLSGIMMIVASCSSADEESDFAWEVADEAPPGEPLPQSDDAPAEAAENWMDFEDKSIFYGYSMEDIEDIGVAMTTVDDSAANYESTIAETPVEHMMPVSPTALGVELMQRMIIRSADMAIATLYYADTIYGIEQVVANRGGFVENSSQRMVHCRVTDMMLWHADFVIRVPVGLFDTTNNELMALGQVQRFSTTSRDATHEFNDLGSRLQIREAEEERVQQMLDEATELADIISLEARLTGLRLTIDAYRRRREEIDQLATFSTIKLAVIEVVELPEIEEEEKEDEEYYPIYVTTFGDHISGAFRTSVDVTARALEGIGVFLAMIILPVGLIGGVLVFVFLAVRKVRGSKLFVGLKS